MIVFVVFSISAVALAALNYLFPIFLCHYGYLSHSIFNFYRKGDTPKNMYFNRLTG